MDEFWALPSKPLCINRIAELDEARSACDVAALDGAPLLLAVSGISGIGKSIVIRTLAYEFGPRFTRTIYYGAAEAEAAVLDGPEEIAAQLLVQLGVSWQQLPDPGLRCSVLRALIEQHRPLIVLDGIESASQVLPLLGDVRQAAVIVAGRRQLQALRAAGFVPLHLRGFETSAGVELIRAVAAGAIEHVEPVWLERLVSVCGGVPELLVAAGIRLADDADSALDFLRELEEAAALGDFVAELSLDDRPVVVAVCAAAYDGLSAEEARAYRLSSAIPGKVFDAELVSAALDRSLPVVKRLLRRLADKALLRWSDGDLVEFPDAMRHHATGLYRSVDSAVERRATEQRVLRWCAGRAVALAKSLSERPIPAAVAAAAFRDIGACHVGEGAFERASIELAGRWSVLVAAARAALESGFYAEAVTLLVALWPFGYQTQRTRELIDGYSALLEVDVRTATAAGVLGDLATQWQLMRDLAGLYERIGETEAAKDLLARADAIGYEKGMASRLEWQALTLEGAGELSQALDTLAQAWAAVPLLDDPVHEERSYQLLRMHRTRLRVKSGDIDNPDENDSAVTDVVTAENYFRARGDVDAVNAARCRALRGDIAAHRGAHQQAELFWSEALDVMLAHGMYAEAASLYERLLQGAERAGRSADAQQYREALHRWRERFNR